MQCRLKIFGENDLIFLYSSFVPASVQCFIYLKRQNILPVIKMKAIVRPGPEPGAFLQDIPYPELKSGWVIIKVKACGICGSDIMAADSPWREGRTQPHYFGHEFAGEVVEVGDGVEGVEVGDRVTAYRRFGFCGKCTYCLDRSRNDYCPKVSITDACMAEYVSSPAENIFKLPNHFSYEEGALIEPLAISYSAVFDSSRFKIGQTAAILGPGPIGISTLITLKQMGYSEFTVITGTKVDVSPRLEIAKKLGADAIINLDEEDPVKKVKELTDGLGVDVVYECAGAPEYGTLLQGLDMLKIGGTFVAIGHPHHRDKQIPFDGNDYMRKLQLKRTSIVGCVWYGRDGWTNWNNLLSVLRYGKIEAKPMITHRVSLEDAPKGFDLVRSRDACKVMVIP